MTYRKDEGVNVLLNNIIVNGRDSTVLGIHPWFAALRNRRGFNFCGGTIISGKNHLKTYPKPEV